MKINTILFFMNTFSGMGFSILSPLFPSIGIKNGLTENLIGWVIGIFALASTCITPLTPFLIKKFTRIKLLYISNFFQATCVLLYSLIYLINSFYGILIIMFIIRIIHGFSCGIIGILLYSLTISLSKPNEIKKELGYLEIGWCLGIIIGPICASVFYKFGGYPLPFLILGIFLFISIFLTFKISEEKTESNIKNDETPPFLKFLKYGEINYILGLFFIGYIAQSFFYPCLTNHLEKYFNLSISISSLFFIIIELSYVIILQFLDYITKKYGLYGTSCLGLFITSLGVIMIYPFPPIPKSLIFVVIGFILIGGGGVPIFIPGLIALNKNIKRIEPDVDELSASDITSAINFLIINIGDFCGPIIGGFFSTLLGFKYCCLIISCLTLFFCLLFFLYFNKIIIYDFQNIESKKSSLDFGVKSEENELINHFGTYKDDELDNIISLNKSYEIIGRRKNSFGLLLKDEMNEYEYKSLDEKN